jgi:hypothetical protein
MWSLPLVRLPTAEVVSIAGETVSSTLSVFQPRGVPGSTSKLSLRVPVQMDQRETEHEGGKGTGKGETRSLRVALRPGRVRLQ